VACVGILRSDEGRWGSPTLSPFALQSEAAGNRMARRLEMLQFDVSRDQVTAVLEFVAESLRSDAPASVRAV
jgi:hypothetical protein